MMPRKIAFGANAASEFQYPENSLVITTTTPDIYEKWLTYMGLEKMTRTKLGNLNGYFGYFA